MSALPTLPRRERLLIGASLCGIALLAWFYTIYEARRMNATGVCECMRMKISGPELSSWPADTLLPLFFMWAIMMIAMMLPSALPMILTFAAVTRNRQRLGRAYVPMSIFVLGYVVIWCVFSALAAVGQWWLHRHSLLSSSMMSTSAWLGVGPLRGLAQHAVHLGAANRARSLGRTTAVGERDLISLEFPLFAAFHAISFVLGHPASRTRA